MKYEINLKKMKRQMEEDEKIEKKIDVKWEERNDYFISNNLDRSKS